MNNADNKINMILKKLYEVDVKFPNANKIVIGVSLTLEDYDNIISNNFIAYMALMEEPNLLFGYKVFLKESGESEILFEPKYFHEIRAVFNRD